MACTDSATRRGSSRSSGSGFPVSIRQKSQRRVHWSPPMRNVASRSSQHSKMFGQPASWQTVCSPLRLTSDWSSRYSGPIRAVVLIHDGFFSIGVALLRTSRRSSRRPSGATLTRSSLRCGPHGSGVDGGGEQARQVRFDDRQYLVDADRPAELGRQRRDARVGYTAWHDPVEPGQVAVAVQRETVHGHALGDTKADRAQLAVRPTVVSRNPHAAASLDLDPAGRDAEVGANVDEHLLDPADERDDVDRIRQPDDRVAHDLPGPVPGDLAAAVDVDDRGSGVEQGAFVRLGALPGGENGLMLEQEDRVVDLSSNACCVHPPLLGPPDLVGNRSLVTDHPKSAHAAKATRWAGAAGQPAFRRPGARASGAHDPEADASGPAERQEGTAGRPGEEDHRSPAEGDPTGPWPAGSPSPASVGVRRATTSRTGRGRTSTTWRRREASGAGPRWASGT